MARINADWIEVFAFRRRQGRREVLLVRPLAESGSSGLWCAVGGYPDGPEASWMAAMRLLREQTGLPTLALFSLSPSPARYLPSLDVVQIVPMFAAQVGEEFNVSLSAEHERSSWMSIDYALDQPMRMPTRLALAELDTCVARESPLREALRIDF